MKTLGLIAEDESDVEVTRELVNKVTKRSVRIRRVLGHGGGRIHAKARSWAENLRDQGCTVLMLIADLDRRNLRDLKKTLGQSLTPCPIPLHAIIIPVREIEAWLLADHDAITRAMKLRRAVKKQANPESVPNPKERLREIVYERSNGDISYLNTIHNKKIAKDVTVANLRRCPSFLPFYDFVAKHL